MWILIFVVGLCTFGLRLSFIGLYGRLQLPEVVRRGLRFVPATVLPALVFPAVVYGKDPTLSSVDGARIVAAVVAGLVGWRSQNVLLSLGAGMGILWLLLWLKTL